MQQALALGDPAQDTFGPMLARHHPHRWRMSRAGFVNVWHYYDNVFDLSGGRLILRGTNGSGKSRALEMLLPFLLDADRRNMGTGSAVRMEDLMSAGAAGQTNRLGYLWLELRRQTEPDEDPTGQFLTLGALVQFSASTKAAKVWYFTTPLRVGHELMLMTSDRAPLSRRELGEAIGEDRISDGPERHRERVRAEVFGLTGGEASKERFAGLMRLLHTLRSPDVGNRIEEGKLPLIVADALPSLSEEALTDAGQQLDGLTSTREEQQRLEAAHDQVVSFLDTYRRYVTGVLTQSLTRLRQHAAACAGAEVGAERLRLTADGLARELSLAEQDRALRDQEMATLRAALEALKESDRYRGAQELTDLAATVGSLATTAEARLETAQLRRDGEADKAATANGLADELTASVDGLSTTIGQARGQLTAAGLATHELPASVGLLRTPRGQRTEIVRLRREAAPGPLARPVADEVRVVPADLAELRGATIRVRDAVRLRASHATTRAADARRIATERDEVRRTVERADEADDGARAAADRAEQQAERRDDEAVSLVERWRAWLAAPATAGLLGDVDWSASAALGPLLRDQLALCGTDSSVDLADLDRAPIDAADSARDLLTTELQRLAALDTRDRGAVLVLQEERKDLLNLRDAPPSAPVWVTATSDAPLWRCVDFAADTPEDEKAGLEAALLASGLLTAAVESTGGLTAASGQLLVSPTGPRAAVSLADRLVPDSAGPAAPEVVVALLGRIGLADRSVPTWVSADGSWANGPVRGRHTVAAAQHIGAAAREARRIRRLGEIDSELAVLTETLREREEQRERIGARKKAIRDHLWSVPRSNPLGEARLRAALEARLAGEAAAKAAGLRAEADHRTVALAADERAHRAACAEFGLPADVDELTGLVRGANAAADTCDRAIGQINALDAAMARHQRAVATLDDEAAPRARAEDDAARAWDKWHAGETRLQALRNALGADPAQVLEELRALEKRQLKAEREREDTERIVNRLRGSAATAVADARAASQRAVEARAGLTEQVTAVRIQLGEPGVVDTAFTTKPAEPFTDSSTAGVDADVTILLAGLRKARIDENALIRAQQGFEREISASYEVTVTRESDILLYELTDADGRRPLVQAAGELAAKRERGRAALTEREQHVFTEFILGEVGEELRNRLLQADNLVKAMNRSLRSIQTSHGIGVRLTWKLDTEGDAAAGRIKQLAATAASVRSQAQDAELLSLLRDRVAAAAIAEPNGGYALYLRRALDYRAWHTVEVIITGPEPGQERKISRRAKLSQGETRFVSYVTLFAAVDAYLSGLDDTATALRLILLDDAFAKVDEPTIAELLGLLVRLDVDFAMTGHALWGCVPQVPALDIYEICRQDGGGPAATVHVRWDGRNRHFLRSA
ncbi:TIGR02680 family protein [Pseudofrankia inefficax]|uniref:TIGR02680 family protein n=1 Tax=Pseudofrankia inefficax (strain DSM 45817 / CECT 9037 / DDB 130130 / EuI1c) TaxID=298654 RepID=E3J1C9_PSEI1|nr:TIGR02680 family protein [Pseudofrankia inefficax]ADP80450.1 hypothetical protein FraEuI1c_2414 [Pseudofrankia inefficax]